MRRRVRRPQLAVDISAGCGRLTSSDVEMSSVSHDDRLEQFLDHHQRQDDGLNHGSFNERHYYVHQPSRYRLKLGCSLVYI